MSGAPEPHAEHEPTAAVARLLLALETHGGWLRTSAAADAASVDRDIARRILRELGSRGWTQRAEVSGAEHWAIGPVLMQLAARYESVLSNEATRLRARWALAQGDYVGGLPQAAAVHYEPSTEPPLHKSTGAVCEVLAALHAAGRPLSLSALREQVGIHRDTCAAILGELAQHGLVELETDDLGDRWSAGPALCRIGRAFQRAVARQAAETGRAFYAALAVTERP